MLISLHKQLIAYTLAIAALISAIVIGFTFFEAQDAITARVEAKGRAVASALARNLIDPIHLLATDRMKLLLRAAIVDRDVVAAHALDEDGVVLSGSGQNSIERGESIEPPSLVAAAGTSTDAVIQRYADKILIARAVRLADHTLIGFAFMELSLVDAQAEQVALARRSAALATGLLALSSLLAYFLSQWFATPVQRLARAAQAVGEGDLRTRVTIGRRDELGQLAAAFNEMVAKLQVASAERESAKTAAEAASLAKSQFLATMSHEIRTPMNGVLGMTELLLDTELSDRQRQYVHTLRNSGEALLFQINDILDFSKIEAGKLELESVDFDLLLAVEDAVEMMAGRAHAKGLELGCRVHGSEAMMVRGDGNRLRQVLLNLLGNAIKFTEKGEVLVDVAQETTGASGADITMQFAVTDTGIGIAREALDRVFEAFTQADSSTTRRYGGNGLGLAICKQLVEMMGGSIGVQSVEGQGSTFWFTVRFERAQSAPAPSPIGTLQGRRVLVADDNATNRSIILKHLEAGQAKGIAVESGPAALTALHRARESAAPFDLVLIDMKMPGMSGLELAREIRSSPHLRGIRLIILTSLADQANRVETDALAISACLSKPVRRRELLRCIAETLGSAQLSSLTPPPEKTADPSIDARILVAEDNAVNQVVISNMLKRLGTTYDVVDHGHAAVEAAKAGGYDLILMDCHMPVLDGYAATAAIRKWEIAQGRPRIPIIAVTANALAGDRDACLAAGMDDHIGKPYSPSELRAAIERWLIVESQTANVGE